MKFFWNSQLKMRKLYTKDFLRESRILRIDSHVSKSVSATFDTFVNWLHQATLLKNRHSTKKNLSVIETQIKFKTRSRIHFPVYSSSTILNEEVIAII